MQTMIEIQNPNIQIGKEILEKIQTNILKNYSEDEKKANLMIKVLDNKGYYFKTQSDEYIIIPLCIKAAGESPAWDISIETIITEGEDSESFFVSRGFQRINNILPKEEKNVIIKHEPYHRNKPENLNLKLINIKIELRYFDFILASKVEKKEYQKIDFDFPPIRISYEIKHKQVSNPFSNFKFEYLENKFLLFYGRDDQIKSILEIIETKGEPKVISLYGERGVGKTAFIHKFKDILSERDFNTTIISYTNIKEKLNSEEILFNLLNQLSDGLDILKDSLPNKNDFQTNKIYNKFLGLFKENLIKQKSQKTIIIFDDIDLINENLNNNYLFTNHFIRFLHEIVKKNTNISLVFVSKNDLEILAEKYIYLKELATLSFLCEIGFFKSYDEKENVDEIEKFIKDSLYSIIVQYNSRAIDTSKKFVSGHPYLLQALWHELIELFNKWNYQHPIDFWDVEQAAINIATTDNTFGHSNCIKYIWEGLSSEEQWALLIFNEMINSSIFKRVKLMEFGKVLLKECNLNLDFIPLISQLLYKNIIEEVEGYYKFKIEIIQLWINKNNKKIKDILNNNKKNQLIF